MTTKEADEKGPILKRALTPDRVCFLKATKKSAGLVELIDVLALSPIITDKATLTEAVFKRESIMSTGIGLGLAVPHVRIASVNTLVMAVGISRAGIDDYVSLDDKPVHLVFLIAAPEGQHVEYLRLLSAISSRAKDLKGVLLDCPDAGVFYETLLNPGGNAPTAAAAGA